VGAVGGWIISWMGQVVWGLSVEGPVVGRRALEAQARIQEDATCSCMSFLGA